MNNLREFRAHTDIETQQSVQWILDDYLEKVKEKMFSDWDSFDRPMDEAVERTPDYDALLGYRDENGKYHEPTDRPSGITDLGPTPQKRQVPVEQYARKDQQQKVAMIVNTYRKYAKGFGTDSYSFFNIQPSKALGPRIAFYIEQLLFQFIVSDDFTVNNVFNNAYVGINANAGREGLFNYVYKNIQRYNVEVINNKKSITFLYDPRKFEITNVKGKKVSHGDPSFTDTPQQVTLGLGAKPALDWFNEIRKDTPEDQQTLQKTHLKIRGIMKQETAESISYQMMVRDFGLSKKLNPKLNTEVLIHSPFGKGNFPDFILCLDKVTDSQRQHIKSTFKIDPAFEINNIWIDTKASIGNTQSGGSTRLQYFPLEDFKKDLAEICNADIIQPKTSTYQPVTLDVLQYAQIIKRFMFRPLENETQFLKQTAREIKSGAEPVEAEDYKYAVKKYNFLNKDTFPIVVFHEVGTDTGAHGQYKVMQLKSDMKLVTNKVSEGKYNFMYGNVLFSDLHFYMGDTFKRVPEPYASQTLEKIENEKLKKKAKKMIEPKDTITESTVGDDVETVQTASGDEGEGDLVSVANKSQAIRQYVSPDYWSFMFSFMPGALEKIETPSFTPQQGKDIPLATKEKTVVDGITESTLFFNGHMIREGTEFRLII